MCVGGGGGGQRSIVSWTKHMTGGGLAVLFFPDSNRHPSTAAISKERHFQSPADQSWIRTRKFMNYNPLSLITWNCASEIN